MLRCLCLWKPSQYNLTINNMHRPPSPQSNTATCWFIQTPPQQSTQRYIALYYPQKSHKRRPIVKKKMPRRQLARKGGVLMSFVGSKSEKKFHLSTLVCIQYQVFDRNVSRVYKSQISKVKQVYWDIKNEMVYNKLGTNTLLIFSGIVRFK